MLTLSAGEATVRLDPHGGRLASLTVGGDDLLTDNGSFVMAPWAGRTGHGRFTFGGVRYWLPVADEHAPHAIHGTVRDRPWEVLEAGPAHARLGIDLGPDWPWEGWCEQVVTLEPASVTLTIRVTSGRDPFPAIVGWHPWFRRPKAIGFTAHSMLQRGPDHLPTGLRVPPRLPGNRPLDDCFEGVAWPITLRWPERALEIRATGCRFAVVYDEQPQATCIEPQTGPPNGLATAEATIVTPEQPLEASTTWSWTP